jgi:hypothetical protein
MEMDNSFIKIKMYIKVNILMAYLKASDNILGQIIQFIKVTLSKATEMVMEFGIIFHFHNLIKVIICLIKSMGSEFIVGVVDIYTKEILLKI